jgi:hypothetical protein
VPLVIEQFGLQWAAALTGHKIQGQTLDCPVCICGLHHPKASVSRKWLYVGSSRTTKSSYLHYAELPKVGDRSFKRKCPVEEYTESLLDKVAVDTELRVAMVNGSELGELESIRARLNRVERTLFAKDAKVLHYFEHHGPTLLRKAKDRESKAEERKQKKRKLKKTTASDDSGRKRRRNGSSSNSNHNTNDNNSNNSETSVQSSRIMGGRLEPKAPMKRGKRRRCVRGRKRPRQPKKKNSTQP